MATAKKAAAKKPASKKAAPKKPAHKARKPEAPTSASLAAFYTSAITELDRSLYLRSGTATMPTPVSSGLLTMDWVMAGGANACFTQISGAEASGKSSSAMMVLASAVKAKVPLIIYIDAEGSLSAEFAENVLGHFDMGNVFRTGRALYYDTNIIEDVAGLISGILRKMPEKTYLPEEKTWAYLVPKASKKHLPLLAALEKQGLKPDKKLSASGKSWVVPTTYSGLEAVIVVDSWASMIPRDLDETEGDLKGGMAANARAFSREIPRFQGKLKGRGVALWSVNQLRQTPGVMYGDPLRESGGTALQYASSARARMFSRAVPQGTDRDPDAAGLAIEPSVTGGKKAKDRYAYKQIVNTKNKYGRPLLKASLRIWVSDEDGKPRGFCPVHDTLVYLQSTGQISGPLKKLQFRFLRSAAIPEAVLALEKRTFTYLELKALILHDYLRKTRPKAAAAAATHLGKFLDKGAVPLRASLFKQLASDPAIWSTASAEPEIETDDDTVEDE